MSKVIVWSRDRGPDLSMLPLRELKDINLDFVQPAIGQRASKQSPEARMPKSTVLCPNNNCMPWSISRSSLSRLFMPRSFLVDSFVFSPSPMLFRFCDCSQQIFGEECPHLWCASRDVEISHLGTERDRQAEARSCRDDLRSCEACERDSCWSWSTTLTWSTLA
jgi:hypothetical protein